jgi:hypothetical protein
MSRHAIRNINKEPILNASRYDREFTASSDNVILVSVLPTADDARYRDKRTDRAINPAYVFAFPKIP